jgi:hypothetical protein
LHWRNKRGAILGALSVTAGELIQIVRERCRGDDVLTTIASP